jgi:hypothetical protein
MKARSAFKFASKALGFVTIILLSCAFMSRPAAACLTCESQAGNVPPIYCALVSQGFWTCTIDPHNGSCWVNNECAGDVPASFSSQLIKGKGPQIQKTCGSKENIYASGRGPEPVTYTPEQQAAAKQTPAESFIDEFVGTSGDARAHQLHTIMEMEKPVNPWPANTASFITESLSDLPGGLNSRLLLLKAKCGTTICELRAAFMNIDAKQTSEDVHQWQQQLIQMTRQSNWQSSTGLDASTTTTVMFVTPDGRPIFISYFVRLPNNS